MKMIIAMLHIACVACFCAVFSPSWAQTPPAPPPQPDMTIDGAMRQQIVSTLITDLNRYYVFPDKAKKFE